MQDKSRGPVKKHPLYYAWYEACANQTISLEYRGDFWGFVDVIGEKPEGLSLCRVDDARPLSGDNFIWKDNPRRLNKPGLTDAPAKSHKSGKEKHPLYNIHYHNRRQLQLCTEWHNDFWLFVEEVGEKKEGCSFQKIDAGRPLSKDNFFWREQILINSTDAREKAAAYGRVWRKKNPELAKNTDLKKRFGIDLNEYSRKLSEQGNVCGICGNPETTVDKRTNVLRMLAVDHNHATGQIRGLLCMACNQGLGNFQEDLQRLKKAVSYLESFITGEST